MCFYIRINLIKLPLSPTSNFVHTILKNYNIDYLFEDKI